jgi:hypothetical protein
MMNLAYGVGIDGLALQTGLSPVIDRPDRRMSLLRRAYHHFGRPRFKGSTGRAIMDLLGEWWTAEVANLREWRMATPRILGTYFGEDELSEAACIALYIHYAPGDGVSAMVLRQLEEYRALGFTIILVTMSKELGAAEIAQLKRLTALIVHRRNFSFDFGAWHDIASLVPTLAPDANELLLVNDSVCGPLHRLHSTVNDMRAQGEGLFGLTENLAPRPHLQSYFLLVRGTGVIADVVEFLRRFRPTAYKRGVIRRGEVRLTSWIRKRGHVVAAVYGYEAVEWIALHRPRTLQRLRSLFPAIAYAATREEWHDKLRTLPLNPTHALWYELVDDCGFPFLKTDLLSRNPIGIPDLMDWGDLIPSEHPELRLLIEEHLDQFEKDGQANQGGDPVAGCVPPRGWRRAHNCA